MKITQLYYTVCRLCMLIVVLWVAFTNPTNLAFLFRDAIAIYIVLVIAGLLLPALLPEVFEAHRASLNAIIDLFLVSFAVICTGGVASPLKILYVVLFILYTMDVPVWCQVQLVVIPIIVGILSFNLLDQVQTPRANLELMLISLAALVAITIAWRVKREREYADHINSSYGTVNILTKAIMSSMKLGEVIKLILGHVKTELEFDRGFIFNLEEEKGEKVLKYMEGVGVATDYLAKKIYYVESRLYNMLGSRSDGVIPRTFTRNRSYLVKDAPNDYNCDQDLVEKLNLKSFIAVPLSMRDKSTGVLVVDRCKSGLPITENDEHALRLFAGYAAIAISHARMFEEVERLSIIDGMTGSYNHRYFRQTFGEYLHLARRYDHELSMIMIDVDNFKQVNDRYGHQAGDAVLVKIVEVMGGVLRVVDILARYGGEEFAIILPEVCREGTRKAAERLRSIVEETKFEVPGETLSVTISLGIATFREDGSEIDTLIKIADARLYEAKRSGKNKVFIGNPQPQDA